MFRTIILLVVMLLQSAVPLRAADLMVLGDSLSAGYGLHPGEGWVWLLEKRLTQQGYSQTLVNASISGETTSGGLARLDDLLERHQPQVVLLQLGANDGLRGTPLSVIEANLQRLVSQVEGFGAQAVMIGIRVPPNYGVRYAEGFFNLFAEIADRNQLPRVPFLLDRVALDWSLMQPDGLHPTAAAQPIILETVWPVLEPLLNRSP